MATTDTELALMPNYTDIFFTVPLTAQTLERKPDGKKTDPGFPQKGWLQYTTTRNTQNTPLLCAIARHDFIGIDVDNTDLFEQLLTADNYSADYIAKSDLKGGHILYAYNEEDAQELTQIRKWAKRAHIDIQLDNSLIYLATQANHTKTLLTPPLTALPQKRIPLAVKALVYMAAAKAQLLAQNETTTLTTAGDYNPDLLANSTLGYILNINNLKALPEKELAQAIDKIIPKKLEYRHPRDVPNGEGTAWMTSIRFKLAQDPSVSKEQFQDFMLLLNSLWQSPMPEERVIHDCNYDINKRLNPLTNRPLWQYNPDWAKEGFIYENEYSDVIEILFDPVKQLYIHHNRQTGEYHTYDKTSSVINTVLTESKLRLKVTTEKLLKKVRVITIVHTPEYPTGLIPQVQKDPLFNTYQPSEGIRILRGELEPTNLRQPDTILALLRHLIPDADNRDRFCRFLARKHSTYDHSDLYFVFAGVGGAGKNMFIDNVLPYFSTTERIYKVNVNSLTNGFNKWMGETDYAIIDEAGEGDTKNEQAKLVAELKKITGSPLVSITKKGKDTTAPQRHYMTPILNTNMQTKLITDIAQNDRRLVLFKCPTKLAKVYPDTTAFYNALISDLPHFAAYLRSLKPLSNEDYKDNSNWKNEDYAEYIEATTTPLDKLLEAAENRDHLKLLEVLTEDFAVPMQDIDRLFEVSTADQARAVFYNTSATKELGLPSLIELLDSHYSAVEIKSKIGKYKRRVTHYKNKKPYNVYVIEFSRPYTNLDTVEPLAQGEAGLTEQTNDSEIKL